MDRQFPQAETDYVFIENISEWQHEIVPEYFTLAQCKKMYDEIKPKTDQLLNQRFSTHEIDDEGIEQTWLQGLAFDIKLQEYRITKGQFLKSLYELQEAETSV